VESEDEPGVYSGTYRVRAGDDILNGRVTARLVGGGQEDVQQSIEPITIDTVAPRILGSYPEKGAVIDITQPNITVYADDTGGSGLARATITITNNNETITVPTTVAPPTAISGVPQRPLSGTVMVTATIWDAAKNQVSHSFSFTVRPGAGPLASISHNATRALQAGEVVTVEMTAEPGGRANFDVIGEDNRVIAQGIAMTQIAQGRYRGSYTIQGTRDVGQLRIVGRFVDGANQLTTREATSTVRVLTGTLGVVTITDPTANAQVNSPLVVRGRAAPRAIVDVSVRAEGTQYLIFKYVDELGTQQIQADRNGNWVTQPIELPRPRVANLRYVITVVQTDAANRQSEPVSVTVQPAAETTR